MANTTNFPGPNLNRLIEEDPQIVRIPLDYTGFGARKSAQPKDITNFMRLDHVKSK